MQKLFANICKTTSKLYSCGQRAELTEREREREEEEGEERERRRELV